MKRNTQIHKLSSLGIFTLFLILNSCVSEKFDAPMKLGGKWISSDTLNLGHDIYMNNCMSCHGVNGDGQGPASQGSMPLPRNFKAGLFKFAQVSAGELPRDEDLIHTIRYGLRGTPMLPWDLSDEQLYAVVQYIKTFSEVWKDGKPGEMMEMSKDPWGVQKASEAIAQGEKIYHGLAQCYSCHPSYTSMDKISQYSEELTGSAVTSLRDHVNVSTNLDSSYGTKVMPPDFTKTHIKTGGAIKDIYWVLGVGVGGTAMPSWKGVLSPSGDPEESERNQWALAYYVNHLYELKFDWEKRKEFIKDLNQRRELYDQYDSVPEAAR